MASLSSIWRIDLHALVSIRISPLRTTCSKHGLHPYSGLTDIVLDPIRLTSSEVPPNDWTCEDDLNLSLAVVAIAVLVVSDRRLFNVHSTVYGIPFYSLYHRIERT